MSDASHDFVTLRMTRDDPRAWAVMPQLLERIEIFCTMNDVDTPPEVAVDMVRTWFALGDPRLGLWVGLEGEKVIGHLLATPEPVGQDTWRYVLIRHAWTDRVMRREAEAVWKAVRDWTLSLGLSRVMMVTHRGPGAMTRRWGFKPFKMLMVQDLKE